MTLSTTVSIVIAALCVASVAGVAWWLKPVFDKKREELLKEEKEDLTAPADPSHNILMIDPIPEKGPNPPIEVSSYEEFANAGIKKDAEDLQEELKAETSKKPKRTSKSSKKKAPAADTQNKPKRGRPKKTTIE